MSLLKTLLPLLLLAVLTDGQATFDGKCPVLAAMINFWPEFYEGTWYVFRMYINKDLKEQDLRCITHEYTRKGNGLEFTQSALRSPGNIKEVQTKTLVRTSSTNRLASYRTIINAKLVNNYVDYNVVATNYDSYAIVWACVTIDWTAPFRRMFPNSHYTPGVVNKRTLYILTRDKIPSKKTKQLIKSELRGAGLKLREITKIDQKNC